MAKELERFPIKKDLHTEFSSRSIKSIHRSTFMPDVCAFLNTDGGSFYFGVDQNGIVVGNDNPIQLVAKIESILKAELNENYTYYVKVKQKKINKKGVVLIDISRIHDSMDYASFNDRYYFRVEDKTIGVDEPGLDYALKVVNYKSPIYTYYPSNLHPCEYREIGEGAIRIQYIGEMPKGNFLYKYMDLESALCSLENNNLRFVEPTKWDDQYEGRFYNAKYYADKAKHYEISSGLTPFLYASCFTTKRENEAAWVIYSHNKKGLASRCVEFRLNRRKLFDQLSDFAFSKFHNGKYASLFFGRVMYENKFEIDNIHNSTIGAEGRDNTYYHKYFDKFSLECYLNLLLLKRVAFEHEQEIRVFIIPPDYETKTKTRRNKNGKFARGEAPLFEDVPMCWGDLIEEVRIDKKCSKYEKKLLQNKLDSLYEKQKKFFTDQNISFDDTKLKSRFQLIEFNPYEDEALSKGTMSIVTN